MNRTRRRKINYEQHNALHIIIWFGGLKHRNRKRRKTKGSVGEDSERNRTINKDREGGEDVDER